MPQFFVAAAAGAAIYAAYRFFQSESERVSGALDKQKADAEKERSGTLVRDPSTGEYRPRS